jgi:hypothetical protein
MPLTAIARRNACRRLTMMVAALLLALPFCFASGSGVALAQTGVAGWSLPAMLYQGPGTVSEPALAADQTGALHAFWLYDEQGAPTTIYYARWDGSKWTQPVDVVAMTPFLAGPSATVDKYGQIHLIWHGPGNQLYYSQASAANANTATAWTTPIVLAQSNPHAQIVADPAGTLHVVYSGAGDSSISYVHSTDGGRTWSEPTLVADLVNPNATADFALCAITPGGQLHVVWTELTAPSGYPPLGVYYARPLDDGRTWARPYELAGARFMEVNILALDDNTLHVAWNGMAGVSGRYHRLSTDAGRNWSSQEVLSAPELGGGSTNPPALAADSAGTVHIIINTSPGNQVGSDATMYIVGQDRTWSAPIDISQAAPEYRGVTNEASPLTISKGNQASVLFVDNNSSRLWHTWKTVSAPAVEAVAFAPLPAQLAAATPSAQVTDTQPTATAKATTQPTVQPPSNLQATSGQRVTLSTTETLVIGILPAFVLIAVVMVASILRRRSI